jgi:hypothetical protein
MPVFLRFYRLLFYKCLPDFELPRRTEILSVIDRLLLCVLYIYVHLFKNYTFTAIRYVFIFTFPNAYVRLLICFLIYSLFFDSQVVPRFVFF